jgi:hypothetical protein
MAGNDKIIIDKILEEKRISVAPLMTPDDYFQVFTSEQILKDYSPSYEEIELGITDGGDDGGVDSFYVVINGELLQEDSDFSNLSKDISIDVHIIQSKSSEGFSEDVLNKFITTTTELFDLSISIENFQKSYNSEIISLVKIFREMYEKLASKFPNLNFYYHFATKGNTDEVHPKLLIKLTNLEKAVKNKFSTAKFSFNFLGAKELLSLARREPSSSYTMRLSETPILTAEGIGFIGLVSLSEFNKFIVDENGNLRLNFFEANVRDYQGKVSVNAEIQATLEKQETEDFWWLNNGVTILAGRTALNGKDLSIENPEIVNGLQTSREIFSYFRDIKPIEEKRNLLIRVIVPNAEESRDRIIKATNNQTSISPASLRATEDIHRNIEQYLSPFGIFYDRRKNFYKNAGRPIKSIVSIIQLAQAVESILMGRPEIARGRPSSIIKNDEEYEKIFNREYPIGIYRSAIEILRHTESFLSRHVDKLPPTQKNNLKFYIVMVYTCIIQNSMNLTPKQLNGMEGRPVDEEKLQEAYILVKNIYENLGGTDQVAKGSEMLKKIKEELGKIVT